MLKKSCPHCFKRIPLLKQWKRKCPFCFRSIRQRSDINDRGPIGLYFEDRGTGFWFFLILVVHVIAAMIGQVIGKPDLLNFIDKHTTWFVISIFYLSAFFGVIGRIYFPLMLGAPKILRKERQIIRQYRWLTATGLLLGPIVVILSLGVSNVFYMFPATVFLGLLPVAIFWAYLALALSEADYEDERNWSFLTEVGAAERLEHRHHGYMVLGVLPVAGMIFYYFVNNLWIAYHMRNSVLIAMFRELWKAARERGANL